MTTNATGVVSVESQAGTVTLADGLIVLVPDQSVEPAPVLAFPGIALGQLRFLG